QILERRTAPVARDRIGELLAVAGRSVEVDRDRGETLACVGFGVPAVMEVAVERTLRPAMDQECDRVLLPRLVTDRLDHVTLHGVATGAPEREELAVAELDVGQSFGIEVGDLRALSAVCIGAVEIGRMLPVLVRDDESVRADVETGHGALADPFAYLAARDINGEQRMRALVIGGR